MKKILLFLILATPVMGMSVKEAEKILKEPTVYGWRVEVQSKDLIKLTAKVMDPFTPFLELNCVLKKDEKEFLIIFYLEDPRGVIQTPNNDGLGYIRILKDDKFRDTYLTSILPGKYTGIYNLNYILQSEKSELIVRAFGDFLLKRGGILVISPVPGVPKGKHIFSPDNPEYIYAAAVVLTGGLSKADFYKSLEMPDFSETEFKLVPYK